MTNFQAVLPYTVQHLKFSKSDPCILFPFVHTKNIINLSMVEEYRIWIFWYLAYCSFVYIS